MIRELLKLGISVRQAHDRVLLFYPGGFADLPPEVAAGLARLLKQSATAALWNQTVGAPGETVHE